MGNNYLSNYTECISPKLLSEYRGALMGFSIILIVLYHFFGRGGVTTIDKIFRGIFSQGYIGVDFFMVVSGLGLTYSMMKDECLRNYYIKRWLRIFPVFTFLTLVECWIIRGESFPLALLRSTTLGYWFDFPYIDWFVPALVGLYVIFPAIFTLIVKPRRYMAALTICIVCVVASVVISENSMMDWKHLALVYRIPDFFMGIMAGMAIKDGYGQKTSLRFVVASCALGLVVFLGKLGNGHHYVWFANMCFTPLYLCVLCNIFHKLNGVRWGKCILSPFNFVGLFTLEWYRISSSFERLLTNELCPENHLFYVIIWFFASAILSYLTYRIILRIKDVLHHKLLMIIKGV